MTMQKKQYLIRTYDTYFQDVRRERVGEFINDDAAIDAAKLSMFLLHPQDTVKVQVCRKGLGCDEWCMFAAVYYEDGLIVVDDCFC